MFDATMHSLEAVTFATAEAACEYARAHGVPQNFSLHYVDGRVCLRRASPPNRDSYTYICKMDRTSSTKAEER